MSPSDNPTRRSRSRRDRSRSPHDRSSLQHEAEHTRPRKKSSVMSYLAILFAAAFLLLLMSYFMQQRLNREAIDNLQQTSNSAVQTLDQILQERDDLKVRTAELEGQTKALESQLSGAQQAQAALQTQAEQQEKALAAMDYLWRIQRTWSRGARSECRELVEQFEASGMTGYLPDTALSGVDGPSPAEQYEALLDALGYQREA